MNSPIHSESLKRPRAFAASPVAPRSTAAAGPHASPAARDGTGAGAEGPPISYRLSLSEAARRLPLHRASPSTLACAHAGLEAVIGLRGETLDSWPSFLLDPSEPAELVAFEAGYKAGRQAAAERVLTPAATVVAKLRRAAAALRPVDCTHLPVGLAERLTRLLELREYNQAILARLVGTHAYVIGRWCRGEFVPHPNRRAMFQAMEQHLEVPPGTLTDMIEVESPSPASDEHGAPRRTAAGAARSAQIQYVKQFPPFDLAADGSEVLRARFRDLTEYRILAPPDLTRAPVLAASGRLARMRGARTCAVFGQQMVGVWSHAIHHGGVSKAEVGCHLLMDTKLVRGHIEALQERSSGKRVSSRAVRLIAGLMDELIPEQGWLWQHPEIGVDAAGRVPTVQEWSKRCAKVRSEFGHLLNWALSQRSDASVHSGRRALEPVQDLLDAGLAGVAAPYFLERLQHAAQHAKDRQRRLTATRDYAMVAFALLLNVGARTLVLLKHGTHVRLDSATGSYRLCLTWDATGVHGQPCSAHCAIDQLLPGPAAPGAPCCSEAFALYLAAAANMGADAVVPQDGLPVFRPTKGHRASGLCADTVLTQFTKLTRRYFAHWTPRGFTYEGFQLLMERHLQQQGHRKLARWIGHSVEVIGHVPDDGSSAASAEFQHALNKLFFLCFGSPPRAAA